MCTGPSRRRAVANASPTEVAAVTSATTGRARSAPPICSDTCWSRAESRPRSDTRAPASASAAAIAAPIPRLAPVTSACRSARVALCSLIYFAHRFCGSRGARLQLRRALQIALELLPPGKILLRPPLLTIAEARRGLERPGGIGEVRAGDGTEVGAAGGNDGVDMVGLVDVADGHGRDAGLVANLVGEGCLPHPAVHGFLPRDGLSGGDIDEIDPFIAQRPHDEEEVGLGKAALGPVRRRDAH